MISIEVIQHVNIIRHVLKSDGKFPNNALLPLLIYQKVLQSPLENETELIKQLFEDNGWTQAWVDGIYDYHHYHSTAHEVLGVIKGSARVEFGGPSGVVIMLEQGDVVLIPAGVAHKAIDAYDGFTVMGAYPEGQDWDIKYGKEGELEEAVENIKRVQTPLTDPVYGMDGPLVSNWK